MAIVVKDRVKETFTTTGTADFTLGGAAVGYQAFSAIGNTNYTYYAAVDPATGAWEVGYGQYLASGPTLTRVTILSSSAAGAKVSFGSGSKDVFCTYPSEKAIYEEPDGDTLINAGPITVLGPGVVSNPTAYADTLGRFYGNVDSYQQIYIQNQYNGVDASADIVAYNNLGDGTNYFIDMGMAGSTYSSMSYPIFSANSAYLYNSGLTTGTGAAGETSELLIGTGTLNSDLVLFTGGVNTTNEAVRISGADQTIEVQKGVTLNETLDVTGAATFGGTVLLDANPTTALQAATKQYVDNQVTAGLHIHDPVRVETTGNLTATYVQGGTTFNITDITSTTTVTTSVNHGLVVNDQIWLYTTAGNGLSTNTAYFVFSTPALNQLTLSLTFDGTQITGLTNASGLTYATRANSGVGATLTNSGTQVALTVDGIALSVGNRVMVRLQTNGAENGVYEVTTVGSGSTNWVLTRTTDANMVNPGDPDGLGTGDYFFTQEGVLNAGDSHVLTTEPNTMIIGYTPLTYTQFSGSVDYVGGTNIDITGQTISLTGTVATTNGGTGTSTVTTGDLLYGSGTNAWSKLGLGSAYQSLVVNGSGTQVEWNAVNLSSAVAVTGTLGATYGGTGQTTYTLGDTLYSGATNTLTKLAGNTSTTKQYLSQTGTGSASAAPSWATISAADIGAGTLPATRGGTDNSSYAVGDLLYADTTTTLAKLADVATGNVLISGGVSTAPAWGKVALASAVSGTLGIANGGTSATTANAAFNALAPSQTSNSGKYLTTNGTDTSWATVAAGGTFSAGTTGFTPSTPTSGAVTLAGTLNIANGGTASTTAQGAMNTLAGATTSGSYLRGNGTNVVMATIVAGDVPTLNQNTTGSSGSCTGNAATATTATSATSASNLTGGNQTGNIQVTQGIYTRYGATNQTDTNDGVIGAAVFGTGLNIVGTQTTSGTGRQIRLWGSVITDSGVSYVTNSGTWGINVTGSSGSCTGNAATATTATNQSGGTVNATTATVTPNTTGVSTGLTVVNGDITTYRSGGTTGVIYLSNSGTRYLYWDGTNYNMPGGNLIANITGNVTGSSGSCTGNAATATTATNLSGGTVAATTITATGNITAYFSDERLKTRLGTIENALAKVQTLDGFYYEPNETAQALGYEVKREVGVSAQQVQAILPEIIAPAPIDNQYLTVDYERLVPLLIEAIKELKAEVDELKKAK